MELAIKDASGALEVSEATFGREFNEALVHQVVVAYAAGKKYNGNISAPITP